MNILHIHQDYPDGRPYPFTKAVSNLIASSENINTDIQHTVVSINRTSNPFNVSVQAFEQGISVVYWAIPLPIIYYWSLKLSSLFIYKHIKDYKITLIHGHKLTCEGVLAYFLSKKCKVPYAISVRGGSDLHNIQRMPLHKRFFGQVFTQAKKVFWVSAWAKQPIQTSCSISSESITNTALLPNICNIDLNYPQLAASQRKGYITAISYHQYKRKGLTELIEAITLLHKTNKSIELNIYGSGDISFKNEIEHIIADNHAEAFVHLKGQVSQSELLNAMSMSKGFLLPAMNETFGMAYVEALSVGCPILYVENTGIDGYLENMAVGEKLSTVNVNELIQAIAKIEDNNEHLCETIKSLQNEGFLSFYTSSHVAKQYINNVSVN